ncbi:glycosyl hydrolase [Oxalobacteraceae bacterium]|nr:glycosyl hydrolase [Oxalobacteraceae bacterium]
MTSFRSSLCALALVSAGPLALAAGAPDAPRFVYSPYKHLAMWNDAASNVITAAPEGVRQPYISGNSSSFGRGALTWAFASGECGAEQWGKEPAQAVADANVGAFDGAGIGYIISTGGQGSMFTCASDAGMERFIARYDSPHLLGIDFDIEEGQSEAQVASLLARAVAVQARRPALRFSFTVATLAASDGSRTSLNGTAEMVLRAVRASGLRGYALNLMVMDYGPASAANCVVRQGRCDMGRSAIQAVRNVHAKYGVPLNQIEVTPMVGVNDVVDNVFSVADARYLAGAVRAMKLAGLHFWSLDRDTPCRGIVKGADATCSTLNEASGAFARVFARAFAASGADSVKVRP